MDFYPMSDHAIAEEIGERLRAFRLLKNLTQDQVAKASLLSLNTIKTLEGGKGGKLSAFIAVLRSLEILDGFDHLLPPDQMVSPLQLAKLQGNKRRRASGKRVKLPVGEPEW